MNSTAPVQTKDLVVIRASRQRRLLTEPILFEERGVPVFVRIALGAAAALLALFVVWTSLTRIDEIAVAPGQVVPSAQVKVVQHLEGGVVGEIKVADGQMVEAGQVLVHMDPAQAGAELDQVRARAAGLTLRAERLNAIAENREPDFTTLGEGYADLVADQRKIWINQVANNQAAMSVVDSQIDQRRREIRQHQDALEIAEAQLKLAGEQSTIRRNGLEGGIVSQQVYLETKRSEVTARGEVMRLREQIRVASDALSESEKRRQNLATGQRQDALNELGTVTAEFEQVKNAILKAQDRVDRLDIRAPVRGLIQELKVTTVGEVIPSGGLLMRVVPVDDVLEAEVRVATEDVGHVQIGQPVKVKLSTYPFTRYGTLPGTLTKLSPSTFIDDKGKPYYKGIVSLARPYLGDQPGQHPVLPGMTIDGDIVTGDKSLMEYLLKPVFTSLKGAFHER